MMKPLIVFVLTLGLFFAGGVLRAEENRDPAVPAAREGENPTAVENVLKAGLMQGYPDGEFHPEGEITRAQLARIIDRTFNLGKRDARFAGPIRTLDVPRNHWAWDSIQNVLTRDIMQGYREGYFYPDQPVSRAEALAIFAQAYGVYQYDENTVNGILQQYDDAGIVPRWAQKALATAIKHGFVDTAETDRLYPQQTMTRGAMAYTLNEYLQQLNSEGKAVTP